MATVVGTIKQHGWKIAVGTMAIMAGIVISLNGGTGAITARNGTATATAAMPTGLNPLLVPGSGWEGDTAQPSNVGNAIAAGYTQAEKAIARWDVVPYQTFSGDFNVGLVAFHSSGIDHVAFAVNGGEWRTVAGVSANPPTANTSGVGRANVGGIVEYWATLRASDFASDGAVEVRAIAYPKIGTPRVLESLYLVSNKTGTMNERIYYIAPAGSDSTGDGSSGNPLQTMAGGVAYAVAHGGASRATIRMAEGSYSYGYQFYNGNLLADMDGWLTFEAAPGATPANVKITSRGVEDGFKQGWIRLHNLKLAPADGTTNIIGYAGAKLWLDGVLGAGAGLETYTGGDARPGDLAYVSAAFWDQDSGNFTTYATNTSLTVVRSGFWSCELVRNGAADDIGTVAYKGCPALLNVSAAHIYQRNLGDHEDVIAWFGASTNAIVYGAVATDTIHAQGLFGQGGQDVLDLACKDVTISVVDEGWAVFTFERPMVNAYFKDCTLTGLANFVIAPSRSWTGTDVVLENVTFHRGSLVTFDGTTSMPPPFAGVTIR